MNILKAIVFSIIMLSIPLEGIAQDIPKELYDEKYLRKILNVNSFDILKNKNYQFNGVLKVDKFGKYKELFCVLGKYHNKNKKGYKTFVAILSRKPESFKKEKIFEFFSDNVDFLSYKSGVIMVAFEGKSDNMGWIKWIDGRFRFRYIGDPEF